MARGKVHLKKIQNPVNRRVTFSKRKGGLLKKAKELSLLCDAEVGLIIFSPTGKIYESAKPSMNRIMEKYQKNYSPTKGKLELPDNVETLRLELENMQKRITHLEKSDRHMIGEDLELLNFRELQCLEKQISLGARRIWSRKEKLSIEYIRSLKMKEDNHSKEEDGMEMYDTNDVGDEKVEGDESDDANKHDFHVMDEVDKDDDDAKKENRPSNDEEVESEAANEKTNNWGKANSKEGKAKSLKVENANLVKKVGRSCTPCHFSIDSMERVNDNSDTDAATQQDLPQTNLNLTLS